MCNFRMDELQGGHSYGMILGHDIFPKLKIDLCFSDITIRGNVGM